jgi:hypothetical protein
LNPNLNKLISEKKYLRQFEKMKRQYQQNIIKSGLGAPQVVEHLPSKHKALNSNPNITKTKKLSILFGGLVMAF